MNRILPIGLSLSDTSILTKLNIGIESITIGQSAGLGVTGINNIFLGNKAGFNATNVSDSLFIGMNSGTNIISGKQNIIIGEDNSIIDNKLNTISIGYNSIANNSIGVGINIVSNGNSNISYGNNINSYGVNSISYGNYIDITNSLIYIDSLKIDNNIIDNIIIKSISGNTNYNNSSILYKRYDIDNNNKFNIIDYNSDIILNFRINININFKFSLGFYTNNTDINVFTIDNNKLYYNNIEYDIKDALLYESDNILHIVNNISDISSIIIYINPKYNLGFTKKIFNENIINKNINNIRISYNLNDNNSISDYGNIIDNNVTFNSDIFNNKNIGISFNDFIISINNIDENNYNNVAYGKNISIKGTKNICMGNNLNAKGYNSILIGDNISYYDTYKFNRNIENSIIIGNNNFKNNYNKNSIIIGNDNFNNIINENNIIKYEIFLKKNPIIISSKINNIDYVVNIADIILKYDDEITEKQVLLSGLNSYNNKTLPVAIGYSNISNLNNINDNYKLYVKDGIYTDKIYSDAYYGNGENLINISLDGKTTSSLIEGNNLYFTRKRVEEILLINNNNNNYISNNNDVIINNNLNVLGNINGIGSNISNLNMNNARLGTLSIARGGTGLSSFSKNSILTTNSNGEIQSSVNILSVSQGGTGKNTFIENKLLFGNGINAISCNILLHWDNTNNRLGIGTTLPIVALDIVGDINFTGNITNNGNFLNFGNSENNQWLNGIDNSYIYYNNNIAIGKTYANYTLDVNGEINATLIRGVGSNITNLNMNNASLGILSTNRGGTGTDTFTANKLLFGNGTNGISNNNLLHWNNTLNRLGIGKTNPKYSLDVDGEINATFIRGSGSNINSLNMNNAGLGTLSVARGGTGANTFTANKLLFGNGTNPILSYTLLHWDNIEKRLGIGNTVPNYTLDVNGTTNSTYFRGDGSQLTNVNISDLNTSLLKEGSNLYWTDSRITASLNNYSTIPLVSDIINSCNYITLENTGTFTNGINIASGQDYKINGTQIAFSNISGSLASSQLPAFTGDATTNAGTSVLTLATVNSSGSNTYGTSTSFPILTVNEKGLITNVSTQSINDYTTSNAVRSIINSCNYITNTVTTTFTANEGINIPSGQTYKINNTAIAFSNISGSLVSSQLPAFSGDATSTAGTSALTLATVNSSTGVFGTMTTYPIITVNAKGLITAVSTQSISDYTTSNVVRSIINSCNYITLENTGAFTNGVNIPTGQTYKINNTAIAFSNISGSLASSQLPAFSGDATTSAGSSALTLATVNSSTGVFGTTTTYPIITVNAKGLITTVSTQSISDYTTSNVVHSIINSCNYITLENTEAFTNGVNIPTGQTYKINNTAIAFSNISGSLASSQLPAFSGDATTSAGSSALTLATVNSSTGVFGTTTTYPIITVNAKGLITAVSTQSISDYTTSNAVHSIINSCNYITLENTGAFTNGVNIPTGQTYKINNTAIAFSNISGSLASSQLPAFSGDATTSAGSSALTLATVNSSTGVFGTTTTYPIITVNAKGLITAVSTQSISDYTTSNAVRFIINSCNYITLENIGAFTNGVNIPTGQTYKINNTAIAFSNISGSLASSQLPAFSGDATTSAGSSALTLATVNSSTGVFGTTTTYPIITVNAKGLITDVSTQSISDYTTSNAVRSIINSCNYITLENTGAFTSGVDIAAGQNYKINGTQIGFTNISGSVSAAQMPTTYTDSNAVRGIINSCNYITLENTGAFTNGVNIPTGQTYKINNNPIEFSNISGSLASSQLPAFSGDATSTDGTSALTLATVNANVGNYGSSTSIPVISVNAKGLITAVSTENISALSDSRWTSESTSNIYMTNTSGNIGIGTTAPNGKLHIYELSTGTTTSSSNASLIFDRSSIYGESGIIFKNKDNPDHYGYIKYKENLNDNSLLTIGNYSTVSGNKSRINITAGNGSAGTDTYTGYVGINNTIPVYSLDVAGDFYVSGSKSSQGLGGTTAFRSYSQAQNNVTNSISLIPSVCATFEKNMWCKGILYFTSDKRVKKNIKDIDDEKALNLILAIEPKTYDYIDTVVRTSSNVFGFIAQQVKEIIPNAITLQKEIIPNIYSVAQCQGNNIYLSSNIDLSEIILTSNTSIKLIDEDGKMFINKIIYSSNNYIKVEKEINTSNVFVYGTEVDDFNSIDKSYIYTLNVCATQILSRKIDTLQQENITLKQENEIFKNELIRIKTHLGIE